MHLALFCPDMTGHLNPMTTLGRALRRLGHRVSVVGLPESQAKVAAAGLEFLPIGEPEHATGGLDAARAELGRLHGFAALRMTGRLLRESAAITLRDGPDVVRRAGIDAIVTDQVSAAGSVADALGLPFAIACNALALHQEPAVPPPVTSWPPHAGFFGRLRNRIGNRVLTFAAQPLFDEVNGFRKRHALRPWIPGVDDQGLVQVAQQPAFFDFPRERLPDHFHPTGPWHEPSRDANDDFPWDRLDGRPLVYASLGTVQNRWQRLFDAILAASVGAEWQLVLSLGRRDATPIASPPDGAIVVPYAPQLALLRRSQAVITHAGMNTALETLSCGVPMVALPLANDQPGVARRLAWLGAAELIPPRHATPRHLRAAASRVLSDARYREAAERCRGRLRCGPGVDEAAALIDFALSRNARVSRLEWAAMRSADRPTIAADAARDGVAPPFDAPLR